MLFESYSCLISVGDRFVIAIAVFQWRAKLIRNNWMIFVHTWCSLY